MGNGDGVVVGQFGDFRHHAQADAALGHHNRREVERNAELLEADLGGTDVGDRVARVPGRHREFAAGDEGRGFARNRGEVRLGESAHHAGAFHRPQGRLNRRHAAGAAECAGKIVAAYEGTAIGGERVGVVEVHHRGAVVEAGAEIDTELLDDVTLDLGHGDLEHHLVAAAHRDVVDHLVRAADEPRGEVVGLLGFDLARHRSGQHDAIAEPLDANVPLGDALADGRADAIEIARDGDVVSGNLLAGSIEEYDVCLTDRSADDIGALGGADDGIGDLGIGDQYVLDVARQVDDDRFADAKGERARIHLAGRGRSRRHPVIAGDHRRQRRIQRQRRHRRK